MPMAKPYGHATVQRLIPNAKKTTTCFSVQSVGLTCSDALYLLLLLINYDTRPSNFFKRVDKTDPLTSFLKLKWNLRNEFSFGLQFTYQETVHSQLLLLLPKWLDWGSKIYRLYKINEKSSNYVPLVTIYDRKLNILMYYCRYELE